MQQQQTELMQIEHREEFSAVIEKVKEFRGNYTGLTVVSAEDLKKAKSAWQDVRNYRLDLEKQADAVKKRVKEMLAGFTGTADAYVKNLKDLEASLKSEINRVEEEARAAKEAERRAKEELFRTREQYLFASGWVYNGAQFYYDPVAGLDPMFIGTADIADGGDGWWQWILDQTDLRLRAKDEIAKRKEDEEQRRAEQVNKALEEALEPVFNRIESAFLDDINEPVIRQQTDAEPLDPFGFDADGMAAVAGNGDSDGDDWFNFDGHGVAPVIEQAARPEHTGVDPSFLLGFEACRAHVLAILEKPEKFTREQLKELIRGIDPKA